MLGAAGHGGCSSWQGASWVLLVVMAVLLQDVSAALEPIKQLGCERGKCYVLHSHRATWEQAQAICHENRTGQLAVIPDQRTQSSLNLMIRYAPIYTQVWVGARNRGSTWRWLDGTPYYGEIDDNYETSADCGYLHANYKARVAAADCMHQKKYLCAQVGGGVLYISSSLAPRSWYGAKDDCAQQRKVLPTFSAKQVQEISDRLTPDYGEDTYWIGLCRQGWVWEGISEEATFLNFDLEVPYCTENKCLSVDYRGVWFDKNCFDRRGFICETKNQPDGGIPRDVSGSTTRGPNSADQQDNHHEDKNDRNHGLLIGIIVGLAVVITALIVLLVLVITRRRKVTKQDKNKSGGGGRDEKLDNIYAEIQEPALPPPLPPSSTIPTANYYDTAGDHQKPVRGAQNLKTPTNDGKLLPQPGSVSSVTARVGPATEPYAVSNISCDPKDCSTTLDDTTSSGSRSKAKPIPTARKGILRPVQPGALKNNKVQTAAHGHGEKRGLARVGTEREATSLMLEENDLYS